MDKLLWIGVGGAIGAVARWALAVWTQRTADVAFPVGTLVVNVLGCLLIGALASWLNAPPRAREELRLFVLVGVLGGFTTFSSYAWEAVSLVEDGRALRAAVYVLLSNALCLLGAWAGWAAVRAGGRTV